MFGFFFGQSVCLELPCDKVENMDDTASTSSSSQSEPDQSQSLSQSSDTSLSDVSSDNYFTPVNGKHQNYCGQLVKKCSTKKNTVSKIGASYMCYQDGCKLRVYVQDDVCFRANNSTVHEHGNHAILFTEFAVLNEVKTKSLESKDSPLRDIFDEVISR